MKKTIRIMEKKEKLTIFGVKPFAIAKRDLCSFSINYSRKQFDFIKE